MALRQRVRMDAEVVGRSLRQGMARALRQVADALREERDVDVAPAVVDAPPPAAPEVFAPVVETPEVETPTLAPPVAVEAPDAGSLHARVVDAIHTIYDPEIPVDIYELGLIYAIEVRDDVDVLVRMTLTSPNCPAAQSLPSEVETKVRALDGVRDVEVEVVFEPPWTPDLMSEEAKLELNLS